MATVPPSRGPAILFFTGGSALRALSRELKLLTHHSIHLMSPFDSGGSSAPLRAAFSMLAVGDIRNRITALLDDDSGTGRAYARFLEDRFAAIAVPAALKGRLDALARGDSATVEHLPQALRDIVRADLTVLAEKLPSEFDLRGASVGNLALVGGYLRNGRDINRTLGNLTSAAGIRGVIRPVADSSAHIAAVLESGKVIAGQHRITSKAGYVDGPIKELICVDSLDEHGGHGHVVKVSAHPLAVMLIKQAELICYPMGSFWTSVGANLLPTGVGEALAQSTARKVYIPSTGRDPEQIGMSLSSAIKALAQLGRRDTSEDEPVTAFVDTVILDRDHHNYGMRIDAPFVKKMGISVIERPLARADGLDPERLARELMRLTR